MLSAEKLKTSSRRRAESGERASEPWLRGSVRLPSACFPWPRRPGIRLCCTDPYGMFCRQANLGLLGQYASYDVTRPSLHVDFRRHILRILAAASPSLACRGRPVLLVTPSQVAFGRSDKLVPAPPPLYEHRFQCRTILNAWERRAQ